MNSLLIQPPFTQLNSPYPAIWYLGRYLEKLNIATTYHDGSIECFHRIFSAAGLEAVFRQAAVAVPKKKLDQESRRRVDAYFAQKGDYCAIIDNVIAFLCGHDPAFAYRLAVGAGIPDGMRTEAIKGDRGGIAVEEASLLATALLNDLADFIRFLVDPGFETVRYAERLTSSVQDFAAIQQAAHQSWIFTQFYIPELAELFLATPAQETILIVISVPFPGCLPGAVVTAQQARQFYGQTATILLGGGYVSTELRESLDPALFSTFDYLCFDGGFGSLAALVDRLRGGSPGKASAVYGTRSRFQLETPLDTNQVMRGTEIDYKAIEDSALESVHPDYREAQPGRYLRIADSANPMHRLWNDTPWLKFRLAYGCYWQRCAFCDTQLHYIHHYRKSQFESLCEALQAASASHGLFGLHFVDEAMPPAMVRHFAGWNRKQPRQYTFWGNVRFDKSWTRSLCQEAAAGGLVAVSGGIEIATSAGLEVIDKGFSLPQLLQCLHNFKTAGILVHAYLIYGFPGQTHQDIADSAEMVRVLLAEGLIDSAFWHRFVLTRHSRLYADWLAGNKQELKPLQHTNSFANNDLRFAGETDYDVWTEILDSSLTVWSDQGRTDWPLQKFLPKNLPKPRLNARQVLKNAGLS